jgi:hypothetical protein
MMTARYRATLQQTSWQELGALHRHRIVRRSYLALVQKMLQTKQHCTEEQLKYVDAEDGASAGN